MSLLGPLAALLGIELNALVARIKRSAVAYSAMALFALIGVIFILVAIDVALTRWVGAIWAPVIIAVVALVIAAGIWFWTQAAEREREKRAAERRRSAEATALAGSAAMQALPLLRRYPWLGLAAVPIAAAAGYFLYMRRNDKDPRHRR